MTTADWPGVPAAHELHLWRAPLDVDPSLLARLAACLSLGELERSARLRQDLDRTRFIAARGWLRMLLARYLESAASGVKLTEGPHGKPRLASGPGWLRFNLSHSDRIAVYAVARDREVGVDVERLRSVFPIAEVARHYYSPRELSDLATLPERNRSRAAFDCWTRKEAYLKALGVGLAEGLAEFDVMVRPGERVRMHDSWADRAGGRQWSLDSFDAGPGYAAAVAVEGDGCSIPDAASPLAPALLSQNPALDVSSFEVDSAFIEDPACRHPCAVH
ncbi:MAG: 4'-phosphopantetheinyl transferase family protein [Chloroflexota bacterium]